MEASFNAAALTRPADKALTQELVDKAWEIIERVEAIPYRIAMRKPLAFASGNVSHLDHVLSIGLLADSVLRLRDGETQVLAGLISDEDRRSANQVPGLARLPVLGRLFQDKSDTVNKTEVVLLITPRVIRNIERPGVELEHFSSGTEAEVGGAPFQTPRDAATHDHDVGVEDVDQAAHPRADVLVPQAHHAQRLRVFALPGRDQVIGRGFLDGLDGPGQEGLAGGLCGGA